MIDLQARQLPVRNQGDRPTCVAFAVSGAHDWMGGDGVERSPEDAMWAAHRVMPREIEGEETSVHHALEGLRQYEHAGEAAWPYGAPRWNEGRPEAALDPKNRISPPEWRRLEEMAIPVIRNELVSERAVVLTLGVVRRVWLGGDGMIDSPAGEKVPGNHAVLVVGASEDGESEQTLKVRNSWGPRWGHGGYGLISERYLGAYGICAHSIGGRAI
ncbi:MAG: C1 family peptidase [Actinobacteria bacterium]|nr:C1 family peptidase [Actinomycetota bacterium]